MRGVQSCISYWIQWLSCRQFHSEPELHRVHRKGGVEGGNAHERAQQHNDEQRESCSLRSTKPTAYVAGSRQCLLSAHVDDIKGTARRGTAEPSSKHLNNKAGQCKADYDSSIHAGIQHKSSSWFVFTHPYVYIDIISPIDANVLIWEDEEAICRTILHDAFRSVLSRAGCANDGGASRLCASSSA